MLKQEILRGESMKLRMSKVKHFQHIAVGLDLLYGWLEKCYSLVSLL